MTRRKGGGDHPGRAVLGSNVGDGKVTKQTDKMQPKKKKRLTYLERLAECDVSEELRVSISLALKKLETSEDMKELELPSSLSSEERKYVHIVSQQMGFKSKSRGVQEDKRQKLSDMIAAGVAPKVISSIVEVFLRSDYNVKKIIAMNKSIQGKSQRNRRLLVKSAQQHYFGVKVGDQDSSPVPTLPQRYELQVENEDRVDEEPNKPAISHDLDFEEKDDAPTESSEIK
ncbi:R3H domain [Trinorchestia longiramus]|nr:R3H domain [Trinorchestia longiramus]